jgi:hypothetical protein
MGTVVLSAVLAHTGWHWMLDRGAGLLQYHFTVPVMNAAFAATVLRWAMLGLIVVGAAWGLRGAFGWMDGRAGTRGGGSTPAPTDPVGATTSGAAREGGAV